MFSYDLYHRAYCHACDSNSLEYIDFICNPNIVPTDIVKDAPQQKDADLKYQKPVVDDPFFIHWFTL